MAKYTEKLVQKIATFLEEDTYSVSEICDMLNVSRKSFYQWKDTKPEFRKALEEATERRDSKLQMIARCSLKRKLEGYTLTETRTTYMPDKDNPQKLVLKSQVVIQKEYAPDTHAIKQALALNDNKNNKDEKPDQTVLSITVNDPRAADSLRLLQQTLSTGKPEKEQGIPADALEPPALPEKKNEPDEKPVRVRDYTVPPGYLYRG